MTTQQPGVETDLDAIWSPALARGLIRDDLLRSMRYCNGYTDLLGPSFPPWCSLAQRVMHSPTLAAIHERLWWPIIAAAVGLHGMSPVTEREKAAAALHLGGEQRVLVVCGPGDFTRFLAGQLGGTGSPCRPSSRPPGWWRSTNSCAESPSS
jgi:hypothetical protein